MDDEALARQLQLQELQLAGGGLTHQEQHKASFLRSLEGCLEHVHEADDELLQALAISLMPLDAMQDTAHRTWQLNQSAGTPSAAGATATGLAEQDYLMLELLTWFKHSFFKWVDSPACTTCGCATTHHSVVPPSVEEAQHHASRTEVHACKTCGGHTRFPRYNAVGKLLETRQGRCGEWANAFLLCCRAAGFVARYVWDINDHVWTEYWSESQQRWVHLDCCEAAYDKPLLYEAGWGKTMQYVVALGHTGVADVTRRYTAHWEQVLRRRTRVPEAWLAQQCAAMTQALRAGLPPQLAERCRVYDTSEATELAARQAGALPASALAGLTARTTGSEEWRQQRGEAGAAGAAAPVPSPEPSPSTPWAALPRAIWPPPGSEPSTETAAAEALLQAIGRLGGGGCRAAGENGPSESCSKAFDGAADTKWLDFGAAGVGGTSWLEFRLEPGQAPVTLAAYDLVSANDCPERDPSCWVLEGLPSNSHNNSSNSGSSQSEGWVVLDEQKGARFAGRHELHTFVLAPGDQGQAAVSSPPSQLPCVAWRLRITTLRDPPAANSVQLAAWSLYGQTEAWGMVGSASSCGAAGPMGSPAAAVWLARQLVANTAAAEQVQHSQVTRLLANIAANPNDPKFRRVRASKLPGVWSNPAALALLLAVGFRPLITTGPAPGPPPPVAGFGGGANMLRGGPLPLGSQPQLARDVFMVLEAGPQAVARAGAAAAALQHMS